MTLDTHAPARWFNNIGLKMINIEYHTGRTVRKFHRKIVETEQNGYP